jgi:GT2 family glycosyltransferase
VSVVRNDANGGYAAGNNVGLRIAREAGASHVAVVNNDVVVEYADLLADAESAFSEAGSLGVVSPQVFFRRDGWRPQPVNLRFERIVLDGAADGPLPPSGGLPPWLQATRTFAGCCWLAPVGVLDRVGYLREDLFLYHEELEYSLRLRRAGLGCAQVGVGRGRVLHAGGTTAGLSPVSAYYGARNLFLLLESVPASVRPRLGGAAVARVGWMAARSLAAGRFRSALACGEGLVAGLRGRRGQRGGAEAVASRVSGRLDG